MGLPGHVVCDGGDMTQTVEYHHYYESHAETIAEALKAGVDCFTDDPDVVGQAAKEAYKRHLITEEDIDRALGNSFRTKLRLGLYDGEKNPYAGIGEVAMCTEEAAALSRKMARESGVLLKNSEGFLPLSKEEPVVLIGPVGDAWFQDWYGGEPPYRVSLKKGIENLLGRAVPFEKALSRIRLKLGKYYVGLNYEQALVLTREEQEAVILEVNDWGFGSMTLYVPALKKYVSLYDDGVLRADKDAAFGWFVKESFSIKESEGGVSIYGWDGREIGSGFETELVKDGLKEAVRLAKRPGKVIAALGCNPMINSKEEIDRTDLILPPAQERLIQEIYRVNPDIVLMLFTNYPYGINWEEEHLPAILQMSTGSQEMGNAAADLLFGRESPAGRLPLTWYRSAKDLPDINDYDIIKGERTYQYYMGEVLYPFGYGLSYTTFAYMELEAVLQESGNHISISVNVENTGTRSGDEVVQVYGTRLSYSRIKYPVKRLIGFRRIRNILPGEKRRVEMEIPCEELEIYDVISRRKCVEEGMYLFMTGQKGCHVTLYIPGEKIGTREPEIYTAADHYDDYENIVLGNAGNGKTCAVVRESGKKAVLIYRDFLWTEEETYFTVNLRSRKEGEIHVFLAGGHPEARIEIACWKGIQEEFAQINLAVGSCGRGQEKNMLYLELRGNVEVEGFAFGRRGIHSPLRIADQTESG